MVVLMLKKYETEKWHHLKMSDKQTNDKPKFKPPTDVDKDADPSAHAHAEIRDKGNKPLFAKPLASATMTLGGEAAALLLYCCSTSSRRTRCWPRPPWAARS